MVDSTGIKFLGEIEWKSKKHGPERRRQQRKLHIGIDAQTLQIRAICVTSNNVSDAAVIPVAHADAPCDPVQHKLPQSPLKNKTPMQAMLEFTNPIRSCSTSGPVIVRDATPNHRTATQLRPLFLAI